MDWFFKCNKRQPRFFPNTEGRMSIIWSRMYGLSTPGVKEIKGVLRSAVLHVVGEEAVPEAGSEEAPDIEAEPDLLAEEAAPEVAKEETVEVIKEAEVPEVARCL